MKVLSKNNSEIWIQVSSGEKTVINYKDAWIIEKFPTWGISGSRSKYIFCERGLKTKYSTIRERVYLHRLIVKPKGKEQVDHIDRNRLNNRRSNLRICNNSQNMANVAKKLGRQYKGVFCDSRKQKLNKRYRVYVPYVDAKSRGLKKRKYLGHFLTGEEAARAYDKEAKKIWGEFAYLNYPTKEQK